MSRRAVLLVEDSGQDTFLRVLLQRLAAEAGKDVKVTTLSARGGAPRMIREVGRLMLDIVAGRQPSPDLLFIGRDANCKGRSARQTELKAACQGSPCPVIMAIPDPHIERWFLIDSQAFSVALGAGCSIPDQKCAKDRYKELLANAVADTGYQPLLGGIEHAPEIVAAMDLQPGKDASFDQFVQEARNAFRNLPP